MPLHKLAMVMGAACSLSAVDLQSLQTEVTLKLRTGGGLSGTVVDHSDHGLVVVQGETPYVFGWSELTTQSAFATKRALLAHRRGGVAKLKPKDHYELGRFSLWLGREDLAFREFARAASADSALKVLGAEAFERYRRRKKASAQDGHPLGGSDVPATSATLGSKADSSTQSKDPVAIKLVPQMAPKTGVAVRDVYLKFGKKVQEVLGDRVTLVESDHFLIWTDWRRRYHQQLAQWCDAMYVALCRQFGLDFRQDIFLAKCPVYCFESKKRFRQFAAEFDGFDGAGAVGYTRSIEGNGHTHVVVYRQGRSDADFDRAACTLVHEGTHAFVHRLYSTKLIPHWVNEGLAELMAERVLGELCPSGENAELLAWQYVKNDWSTKKLLESVGPIEVHQYPLAHSVIAFLEGQGADRFSLFIKDLKSGRSVASAIRERFDGLTMAQLDRRWRDAVRKTKSSSAGGTDATTRTSPLFRVHTSVEGIDYRNVCGSPNQIPILEQNGQGIGVLDYDNDGWVDLFVPNGSTESRWRANRNPGSRLYRNLGNWRFDDVTDHAGVRGNAWSSGVAVADYDADGDFDLYVLNWGPNALYRNNGDGTFQDVTKEANVADASWSSSAAFADFNGDGKLDMYVSNYVEFSFDDYPKFEKNGQPCLYRGIETGCGPWCYEGQRDTLYLQVDNGRFVDRSSGAGLECTDGFRGFGLVAADLDRDGDVDVYVGCDVMPNLRLENSGHGRFESVGLSKGGAYNDTGAHESGMGVAAADIDRSGTLDLLVTNFAGEKNTFYRNDGLTLTDASESIGLAGMRSPMGWGVHAQDFDADGDVDVFVVNGHIYPQVEQLEDSTDRYATSPLLYLNDKGERLVLQKDSVAFGKRAAFSLRGSATADFDNDGDLDIVAVQHNGPLVFFENLSDRKSLIVELIDRNGGRSPMGARVVVENGGYHWLLPNQGYQSSNDHRIHVAMESGRSLVWIEVRWPDGSIDDFRVDWTGRKSVQLRQKARK